MDDKREWKKKKKKTQRTRGKKPYLYHTENIVVKSTANSFASIYSRTFDFVTFVGQEMEFRTVHASILSEDNTVAD